MSLTHLHICGSNWKWVMKAIRMIGNFVLSLPVHKYATIIQAMKDFTKTLMCIWILTPRLAPQLNANPYFTSLFNFHATFISFGPFFCGRHIFSPSVKLSNLFSIWISLSSQYQWSAFIEAFQFVGNQKILRYASNKLMIFFQIIINSIQLIKIAELMSITSTFEIL